MSSVTGSNHLRKTLIPQSAEDAVPVSRAFSINRCVPKALVNKPEDRRGAARAAIEANGGTMIGAWMAFGEDDLIVIAHLPDDESMAGVALAIASTGAIVNGKTTKLLTLDQAVSGMEKANAVLNAYKPPA